MCTSKGKEKCQRQRRRLGGSRGSQGLVRTSFVWASSSFRGPFHEQPTGARAHLIKRRWTLVRRVTLGSRLEGEWTGAEQASTGQDLDLGEQDEQTTSPSEQICETGW